MRGMLAVGCHQRQEINSCSRQRTAFACMELLWSPVMRDGTTIGLKPRDTMEYFIIEEAGRSRDGSPF